MSVWPTGQNGVEILQYDSNHRHKEKEHERLYIRRRSGFKASNPWDLYQVEKLCQRLFFFSLQAGLVSREMSRNLSPLSYEVQ